MFTHKTVIHGVCPINGEWDYYNLTLETKEFIKCEDVEVAANLVRGRTATQETMASVLKEFFDGRLKVFTLTLKGNHGQNNKLEVRLAA